MNSETITLAKTSRARPGRFILRLVIMLAVVGLIGAGLIGFQTFKAGILKQVVKQITSQLPVVATAKAVTSQWQPQLEAVGSLRASSGADLAAEVAGIVDAIHFDSGADVAAGTVLLQLRPNDDDAKLAQLQAVADLDNITYQRDVRQLKAQGVAQATVDTDAGNLKAARAQVAAQQALMDEKLVRAPFAGRLGLRQVDLGQYLAAGTTIVTLQALDPIFCDFYLPQAALGQIKPGLAVSVRTDGFAGRQFAGEISAISSKVDSTSRMVQVRATLKNPDHVLLPGMFATADVQAGAPRPQVTVPQTAISYNPYGSLVFVVAQDGEDAQGHPKLVVHQQFVTTGETRGDQVAITKGLAEGDTVVTSGQLKLRNNAAIMVNNSVVPTDNPHPVPIDQ